MRDSAIEKKLAKAEQVLQAMKAFLPRQEEEQPRLRLTQPGDRILILRYLCEVVDAKVDFEMWGRLNPVEYKRLLEILPRKIR